MLLSAKCPVCEAIFNPTIMNNQYTCPRCGAKFSISDGRSMTVTRSENQSGGYMNIPLEKPDNSALAYVMEALIGLTFGVFGTGWLVLGETNVGVLVLLLTIFVTIGIGVMDILTGGLFACLHLMYNLVGAIISVILLSQRPRK